MTLLPHLRTHLKTRFATLLRRLQGWRTPAWPQRAPVLVPIPVRIEQRPHEPQRRR